ncbi:hypothetical protein CEXT_50911 [Caerostris extrusa]|uniref:Uncharacterized protein n=1 Tax=Caerostris extrusa TaxID=172846 RepID=A0AAV4ME40_CAEEX|nr:hypothetical protein CEXT_50911 [Caerostris extrusa]
MDCEKLSDIFPKRECASGKLQALIMSMANACGCSTAMLTSFITVRKKPAQIQKPSREIALIGHSLSNQPAEPSYPLAHS